MRNDNGHTNRSLVDELKQFLVPQADTFHYRGTTLAGYSRPVSECGGDWWTARAVPDGRVFVLVADVMGHDVRSATIMGVGKAVCDLACSEESALDVGEFLRVMNESVFEAGNQGEVTMTCFVSLLDPVTRRIEYASAGHPSPLVVSRAGGDVTSRLLPDRGVPLGLDRQLEHSARSAQLAAGDVVLWFTDGVTECRNPDGRRLSDRRLIPMLGSDASAAGIRSAIVAAFDALHGARSPDDDVTFVVGRIG